MELKDDGKLKSSFQKAFERSQNVIAQRFEKDDSFQLKSIYDNSLFVEDDKSQHVYENTRPKEKHVSDEPTPPEDFEDLTFPKLPETDYKDFDVKVHYAGPMLDYGGYAKMNRVFIFGLRDLGALIKTHPMETINNVNKRTEDAIKEFSRVNIPNKYPKIFGMTIPDILAHGGRKILFTMMETSHHVHREYADRLNLADEIWTPTTWCRDVFKNSGVAADIRVMPLGVDTERYQPGLEPMKLGQKVRKFVFLSASGWSYRKGFDVVIRAYLEEFSNKDDVSLVISTRFSGSVSQKHKDKIIADFRCFREMVRKPDSDLPHIALHSTYTLEEDMPKLYNAANCFVLISRGEGWGLPYCEAGACEVPVIASDHGGQRDFLDSTNSYLVPPSSYFVSRTQDPPFKNMAWISHFYENQEFPDYEGESFELVKKHMRFVYENYGEAKGKAKLLRKRLVEKYNWNTTISSAYDRLKEICSKVDGATK